MDSKYNKLNNLFNNINETDNILDNIESDKNINHFLNLPLIICFLFILQILLKNKNILPKYIATQFYNHKYSILIIFLFILLISLIFTKNIYISIVSSIITIVLYKLINK